MKSYRERIEALRKSRNFFPNISTIGEFRPHSQTLHFHYLDSHLLKMDMAKSRIGGNRKNFEVLYHELTHWSDLVSTVWGQAYIAGLFDAYHAAESNDEYLFHKLIEQYDEDRRILFPKYYHVVDRDAKPHSFSKRWRQELSSGMEFDATGRLNENQPIFFVSFSDHDDGRRIARQPLSVGALLETTATWAEIRAGISAIQMLDEEQRIVEIKLFENDRQAFVYNENLTVYTAPVHMLSNMSRATDLLEAYKLASILAHVALNLTPALIEDIVHPESFEPFGNRCAAFVRSGNRGYAFAALAAHSRDISIEQSVENWLNVILQRANLPSLEQIRYLAFQFLDTLSRSLPVRNAMDGTRDILLAVGRDRFLKNTSALLENFDPLGSLKDLCLRCLIVPVPFLTLCQLANCQK